MDKRSHDIYQQVLGSHEQRARPCHTHKRARPVANPAMRHSGGDQKPALATRKIVSSGLRMVGFGEGPTFLQAHTQGKAVASPCPVIFIASRPIAAQSQLYIEARPDPTVSFSQPHTDQS